MKEAYYTNEVLKPRFLKMGCKFKKHHGGKFSRGWPDVEIRWLGMVINIEVKMDSEKVTPLQNHELKDIAKHGGRSLIIRRMGGATKALEIITGIGRLGKLAAIDLGTEMQRLYPKATIIFDQNDPLVNKELQKLEVK